jgi:hypothetical protein
MQRPLSVVDLSNFVIRPKGRPSNQVISALNPTRQLHHILYPSVVYPALFARQSSLYYNILPSYYFTPGVLTHVQIARPRALACSHAPL